MCKDTTTANWHIELNADCPMCGKYVDLLDYPDFWDTHGPGLDLGENGTPRSKGVEVTCPKCNEEFTVDLDY